MESQEGSKKYRIHCCEECKGRSRGQADRGERPRRRRTMKGAPQGHRPCLPVEPFRCRDSKAGTHGVAIKRTRCAVLQWHNGDDSYPRRRGS